MEMAPKRVPTRFIESNAWQQSNSDEKLSATNQLEYTELCLSSPTMSTTGKEVHS